MHKILEEIRKLRLEARFAIRTGQALFNTLPLWVSNAVAMTSFDPFFKKLTEQEIVEWMGSHLIFNDEGDIIAVFNNDKILAERPENVDSH